MALIRNCLRYCNFINYLAAGTSLKTFYTASKVSFPKTPFPYEFLDSLEKLEVPLLQKRNLELQKALDENDQDTVEKSAKSDLYFSILN